MVDDPPVPLITWSIPPKPAVERKIVKASFTLPGASMVGTTNPFAEWMSTPWLKKL